MCEVSESNFGAFNGQNVTAFTLTSDSVKATILSYGSVHSCFNLSLSQPFSGIIQSLQSKDSNGKWDDITTGFETLDEYHEKSQYFGCLVGRYANRVGGAQFSLDGKGPGSLDVKLQRLFERQ